MKTITKTFYVNDIYLKAIKSDLDRNIVIRQKDETGLSELVCPATNKIQISWQETEAKYNLTIDEIFDLWADWYHKSGVPAHFKDHLRKKLFGAEK